VRDRIGEVAADDGVGMELPAEPAFGGDAYERTEMTYLREKYAPRPPHVIIAVSDNALDFLLRNRTRLFEAVPLVQPDGTSAR